MRCLGHIRCGDPHRTACPFARAQRGGAAWNECGAGVGVTHRDGRVRDGWAQDEGDGWAQDEGRTAHLVWVLTRGVERYRITARGGA